MNKDYIGATSASIVWFLNTKRRSLILFSLKITITMAVNRLNAISRLMLALFLRCLSKVQCHFH